jgi:dTDP-4-dehydrorhamnose 3,5-epimerase
MQVIESKLKGAKLIEPKVFGDHRGFFMESYSKKQYEDLGISYEFVQDNHSLSVPSGTLRGLHFQLEPKAQTKLVRVTSGAIYDVIVDIRRGSPTFGQWEGYIITAANKRQLLVPKGFAHGFCTLVENTEVLYKVDEYYAPEQDAGILWNDPDLGIDWPVQDPILSDKDSDHPRLKEINLNFEY